MKSQNSFLKEIIIVVVLIGAGSVANCQSIIDPASRPAVFAPGLVSTPYEDVAATFMPDGNTVYFAQGTVSMTICFTKKRNGTWKKPNVAPFSGHWNDWDPFVSPDGTRIYFVSNRPLDTDVANSVKPTTHLWYADYLGGDKWAAPQYIKATFNLDGIGNYAPSVSLAKDLFFYSPRRDQTGRARSYYAKWLGDHYSDPMVLLLKGNDEVSDPCIAPDEGYIIFVAGNDLYISRRQGDGWGYGEKLGPQVNSGESNYDPTVSPDGKMLYYTSNRVKGFYKRDPTKLPLTYDDLLDEMSKIFNGRGNILMIPINLPSTRNK